MAGFFLSVLCFSICSSSWAFVDQINIAYNYADIMISVDQLRTIDVEKHLEKNAKQRQLLQDLFFDSTPYLEKSKAITPWKLLLDGAQRTPPQNSDHPSSVQTCQNSLAEILNALRKEGSGSWARRMIDATGKPETGILNYNILWLGSFSECMDIVATKRHLDNSTSFLFNGQHCIATFMPPGPPKRILPFGPPLSINVGLCIPSICSQPDIQYFLSEAVARLTNGTIRVAVSNYQPRSIPLTTQAIAVISLLSVIGFAIFLGTVYDLCLHQPALQKAKTSVITVIDESPGDNIVGHEDRPLGVQDYTPLLTERQENSDTQPDLRSIPMRVLLALSIYSNGQKILSAKRAPGSLDCIHGIRFLSMTWVILGHTLFFLLNYIDNAKMVITWIRRWTFQVLVNASVSVDSFFVLSGTLVSYILLKQLKNKNGPRHINWVLFYFHRFWRLTPAYMLVLGTEVALFVYLGDGPVWPSETGIDPFCKTSWWTNLLYINNLVNTKKPCFGWSWYLANDMQFFIISPLIVLAFYYKWFAGAIVSVLLILMNFGSTAYFVHQNNPATNFNEAYIKPWCRIGPYVVGIVTGYLLHITEKNKPKIHKGLVLLGWALAAACNLAVLYGLIEYMRDGVQVPSAINAFYQACFRTGWGLGLAWVIFACCRGYGGYVNTVLSWPGIIPLSRLTYTAYLVHPIVLMYYNLSLRQTVFFNEIIYIWLFLGGLVVSYGFAFVTSLAFEAPMMSLEKVVFSRN